MTKKVKPKNESSRMTLAEYVMFAKLKGVDMDVADKARTAVLKVAGEKLGFKKGSGITGDQKTPYVTPEYWEKAFKEINK